MRTNTRKEADAILALAHVPWTHAWELANGYWPESPEYDDIREPWWLFLTDVGPLQLGRRKRVLHIQWDACAFRGLVTNDDVTKSDTYVHAWETTKAIEYVTAWHRAARVARDGANAGALTAAELRTACRNVGVDLECGVCAAIFYTGGSDAGAHTCVVPPRRKD